MLYFSIFLFQIKIYRLWDLYIVNLRWRWYTLLIWTLDYCLILHCVNILLLLSSLIKILFGKCQQLLWHELISKDMCMNFVNMISSLPFVNTRVHPWSLVRFALRILVLCFYFDCFRPVCPNVVLFSLDCPFLITLKSCIDRLFIGNGYTYIPFLHSKTCI